MQSSVFIGCQTTSVTDLLTNPFWGVGKPRLENVNIIGIQYLQVWRWVVYQINSHVLMDLLIVCFSWAEVPSEHMFQTCRLKQQVPPFDCSNPATWKEGSRSQSVCPWLLIFGLQLVALQLPHSSKDFLNDYGNIMDTYFVSEGLCRYLICNVTKIFEMSIQMLREDGLPFQAAMFTLLEVQSSSLLNQRTPPLHSSSLQCAKMHLSSEICRDTQVLSY